MDISPVRRQDCRRLCLGTRRIGYEVRAGNDDCIPVKSQSRKHATCRRYYLLRHVRRGNRRRLRRKIPCQGTYGHFQRCKVRNQRIAVTPLNRRKSSILYSSEKPPLAAEITFHGPSGHARYL